MKISERKENIPYKWRILAYTMAIAAPLILLMMEGFPLIDRKTLAKICAGILLLFGLYLTWRRIKTAEYNLQIALEGQITERFTRAIEQLGSNDLAIRIGGVYALERIAKDSEKDHWPIMEVLTAYVRENAKWVEGEKEHEIKTPADIRAILTVIERRKKTCGKEGYEHLDLHGTDLRGTRLWEAHLERADLRGAHLEEANLLSVHLKRADLRGAHLERAYLVSACLEEANLEDAHLEMANLRGARLEGADLRGAIGLTEEQIESAYIDEKTVLPEYLSPKSEDKSI